MLNISANRMPEILILETKGELTSATAKDFQIILENLDISGRKGVIFDFQDLENISSAGIAALLQVLKYLTKQECIISIAGCNQGISSILRFLGLHHKYKFTANVPESELFLAAQIHLPKPQKPESDFVFSIDGLLLVETGIGQINANTEPEPKLSSEITPNFENPKNIVGETAAAVQEVQTITIENSQENLTAEKPVDLPRDHELSDFLEKTADTCEEFIPENGLELSSPSEEISLNSDANGATPVETKLPEGVSPPQNIRQCMNCGFEIRLPEIQYCPDCRMLIAE